MIIPIKKIIKNQEKDSSKKGKIWLKSRKVE